MTTSELVTSYHLKLKALIYIRQSSPHQILSNQESLKLQYALRQRAVDLGWADTQIEIIDSDLGMTAATAEHRAGFKELIAQVTLGQVGIILSYDVTRLSRNCSDWYPLLDLCGYRNCLIADRDGVYDPGSANGRLLLGLKGQISELELHTIRSRLRAGILNKAQRGELALRLPVGLVRDEQGVVHKHPNQEIQDRITLVFDTFLKVKAASQVVCTFRAQGLCLPRQNRFGDITWRDPSIAAILSMLKNPAYAGAFVYGRSRTVRDGPASSQAKQKQLPQPEWRIRVNDKYPAYVSWEVYEQIQAQLKENYAEYDRNKSRGIPRPGAALLHGLVYCGECGHKLVVQYKTGTRYICNYLRQQYRVLVCQYIPADPIDHYVVEAFLAALSPLELDAYSAALETQKKASDSLEHGHQQQLKRLRYQVALAERQYNQVDPDNRLVAAELERRWEGALHDLQQAEDKYDKRQVLQPERSLPPALKTAFLDIGKKLPGLWQGDVLSRVQKKALLRCLIDKVVIHRLARDQVRTRIIWKGGETTTADLPVPVGALSDLSNAQELDGRVVTLSQQGLDDETIAEQLTQEECH
ncbi:recombinase family protein [Nodosilinea nodulosa]|uniref:recombinase family protein n=1 Tax=Nodosilinea nodulosa TaxID=416001 RepID=UPI0002D8D402|nr:recombinase family protein [Nodosilinea nodulosa]